MSHRVTDWNRGRSTTFSIATPTSTDAKSPEFQRDERIDPNIARFPDSNKMLPRQY
jgi:hypothetical protein